MTSEQLVSLLNLLVAIVFPLFVGIVTKASTDSGVKAVLLAVIALASGLVTQWLAALTGHVEFDWYNAVLNGLGAFVIAVASHFGVWRPTGASAAAQRSLVKDEPARHSTAH